MGIRVAQVGGRDGGQQHFSLKMAMISGNSAEMRGNPRCDICGKTIRIRDIGVNAWCKQCISQALPFIGIQAEGEFQGALREFREGLGSRAAELRLPPSLS